MMRVVADRARNPLQFQCAFFKYEFLVLVMHVFRSRGA